MNARRAIPGPDRLEDGLEQDVIAQLMEAVRQSGLSDWNLAARAGVNPGTLRNWRDGVTAGPKLTTIAKVARALNIRIYIENESVRLEPIAQRIEQPAMRMRPFLWRMR